MEPEFPLTVTFLDTNEEWIMDNKDDIRNELEWFDSNDPEENARVIDKSGRQVDLKVAALDIIIFKLNSDEGE